MPATWAESAFEVLAEQLGPDEAAHSLRRIGFSQGSALEELFRSWLIQSGAPGFDPGALGEEEFWHHLSAFCESLGWGSLERAGSHPGIAVLASTDWFEAERAPQAHPSCHLSTGILAALLHRIAEADLAVLEVRCRAAGDPSCHFAIGNEHALGALHARMRAGEEADRAVAELP